MKQIYLPLLLLFLLIFFKPILKAQIVPLGDTLHFKTTSGQFLHVYVDSIKTDGTDTTFFLNKEFGSSLKQINSCGLRNDAPNWMSDSIKKTSNILYFFHDEFRFNLDLTVAPGQAAGHGKHYYLNDSIHLQFLGSIGNIKQYYLSLREANGSLVPYYKDSLIIEIKSGTIHSFPTLSHSQEIFNSPYRSFENSSTVKYKFLTSRDIFNFEVGDEFHYRRYYGNGGPPEEIIKKIISKNLQGNTLIYEKETHKYNYTLNTALMKVDTHYTFSIETEVVPWTNPWVYDLFNYKPITLDPQAGFQAHGYSNFHYNDVWQVNNIEYIGHIFYTDTTCIGAGLLDPANPHVINGEGLGQIYYAYGDANLRIRLFLVYFRKGNVEKGNAIMGLEKFENPALEIFPNPVRAILKVKHLKENKEYGIYDLHGQIIKSGTLNINEPNIDFQHFPDGLYILKIDTHSHMFQKG